MQSAQDRTANNLPSSEHGVMSVHPCPTISACALHCNNSCKTAICDGEGLAGEGDQPFDRWRGAGCSFDFGVSGSGGGVSRNRRLQDFSHPAIASFIKDASLVADSNWRCRIWVRLLSGYRFVNEHTAIFWSWRCWRRPAPLGRSAGRHRRRSSGRLRCTRTRSSSWRQGSTAGTLAGRNRRAEANRR
jgi:hypothetical protein